MDIILSGVFWSAVLILLGIGTIINIVFRTRIPFFRIFFALLLIYLGISVLLGRPGPRRYRHHKGRYHVEINTGSSKHGVAFGSMQVDLTSVKLDDGVVREDVDVAFGSAQVLLDTTMPIRVEVSSAFGTALLPDRSSVSFGDRTWRSSSLDENKPYLLVEADVAFGSLDVRAMRPRISPAQDSTSESQGQGPWNPDRTGSASEPRTFRGRARDSCAQEEL